MACASVPPRLAKLPKFSSLLQLQAAAHPGRDPQWVKLRNALHQWQRDAPPDEGFQRTQASCLIIRAAEYGDTVLSLSHWGLSSLPPGLGALKSLTKLFVSNNRKLRELPADIFHLPHLRLLNASRCGLETLPDAMGFLCELEELYVQGNPALRALPDSLTEIGSLRIIDVTGCESLSSFPAGVDLYKVEVFRNETSFWLMPAFREARFDPQKRAELETSAKEHRARWQHVMTSFTAQQLRAAEERDALKRARLSTTISQMAASGEESKGDLTFENWKQAERQTIEWARSGQPLSLPRLFEMHEMLYRDIDNSRMNDTRDRVGRLRNTSVWCGDDEYPPPEQVPGLLEDFMRWHGRTRASLESDDLVGHITFAGQIYQRLVSIHPFADANGRVSRLAMNWALRTAGLPPARWDRCRDGMPESIALLASNGVMNHTPEEVAEMVLNGIGNTVRLYETQLGVGRDASTSDAALISDDDELLETVSQVLRDDGYMSSDSDDELASADSN